MSAKKSLSTLVIILLVGAAAGFGGYLSGRRIPPLESHQATERAPGHDEAHDSHQGHGHAETKAAHDTLPTESAGHEAHTEGGHEADDGHGHGHDHGAESSDLDRPIDEMWTARCEHDIPQYQCDECRYEIGAVKLEASLFGSDGPVRTGFPERLTIRQQERSLPGEVQLDESRTVHVSSPLSGRVTRSFTTPGLRLAAGAPLFEIDSPEVADAKSAYLKALSSRDLARKVAEREALLFSKKVAAEIEVQEAQARLRDADTETAASRGRLSRLGLTKGEIDAITAKGGAAVLDGLSTIRASQPGTVIEGHATPGEHVEAGKELLTLSSLDQVWVMADLKDADLAALSLKNGGEATIEALGRQFTGRLATVGSRMNEETRTVKARFQTDNPDGQLKPGMFVTVQIFMPGAGDSLAVPKVAVLADEGRTFVFTHKEGDYWVRRPVTLGARQGDRVEITSGLEAGQKIITDGSFLLKSDVLRGKMGAGCAD